MARATIVFTSHPYDFGNEQPSASDDDGGFLAESDPIFVTEFGSFRLHPPDSSKTGPERPPRPVES